MDNVPDIATQQEVYQHILDTELFYNSVLPQNESQPLPDELPLEREELACFEEIRGLKLQLAPSKSYSNFISEILTEKPVDQLSTPKEAAIADNILSKEKQTLRSIKRNRAEANSRLSPIIEELCAAGRRQDCLVDRLRQQLLASKVSIHANEVDTAIVSENIQMLESLVGVIDEVDRESCEKIIAFVRQVTATNEREASQLNTRVDALRRQLNQKCMTTEQRKKKEEDLERRKEHIAHTVPGALQANIKGALEERLSMVLFACSGVTVESIHENGIQIAIDSTIFSYGDNILRWRSDHSRKTYMLDIEFDFDDASDDMTRGLHVRKVTLSPPDVPVSDLKKVPMECAVREVNFRLCEFVRRSGNNANPMK